MLVFPFEKYCSGLWNTFPFGVMSNAKYFEI